MHKLTLSRKSFLIFNYILLGLTAFVCILPLINVLAISFSSSTAAAAGFVKLLPVDFTLSSYKYALQKHEFVDGFFVSLKRVGLGYAINMLLSILVAYPLSKEKKALSLRNFYAWFFIITMLFSGGLIPTYMTIKSVHMLDTIWALVLPGAVPVFNVILLMNFFRGLPKEIEEAAYIDGAGYWRVLWKIYVPLSMPAIATITLFTIVTHWNSWFDGLIYMNQPIHYPLQSYLQTIIITTDPSLMSSNELLNTGDVSDRTYKAAQVFLAAFPVLLVYPFLQKYFMKGLVMGSVKG
ncbi:carbohydrate ABC transporter permease [Paenibacillus lupini]|uniref:carbohydrate ABC transporter permease n=1 Tax=Paenibacillus lupini TaxID=1450204 RepID=UPI001422FC66|nr:carbohydrate ABC transporter permease [Paenibacillus lupini]NIK22251.1 putative aldouronate transport system permease protein [Paenibacillus lupini]